MNSFVALAFFSLALSLPREGMPILSLSEMFQLGICKNYVSVLGSFKDMRSHSVFFFHPSKLGTDGA